MIIQPLLQNKPAYLKLLIFVLFIIASMFFINVLGILVAVPIFGQSFLEGISVAGSITDAALLPKLIYLQIINQFALFIVPVVLFALFTGIPFKDYLKLDFRAPGLFLLVSLAIILLALPLINWIGELNAAMQLPESMSGIENWMRNAEDQATELTRAFLGTVSLSGFLINLLMIAILPALGEELFFRGILQRLFHEWFKNTHVAIFITAFIFSTIHFQFFGFIPRLLLGLYLGYIFYWSGNLWIPILVHFVNNGFVVIIAFISARGYLNVNYETFGSTDNGIILVLTTIVISGLVYLLFRLKKSNNADDLIMQFPA